ncbi:hypothetical protein BGX31_004530 [Mortierella sp. GBA43]|nr:hypothetical protein BGX31_004530 [Mortierella sp. GBA43]
MSEFLSLANNRDLRLHEDIQTKSCAACGSIFVPGVSAKVRVVPVDMTKLQKERQKKAEKKKIKKKQGQAKDDMDTEETTTSMDDIKPNAEAPKQDSLAQKPTRKVIRITPYSELNQLQRHNRQTGKIDKRSNQLLNHVIYTCLRCNRDTELSGSKEVYIKSRIKSKPQRSKTKRARQAASDSTGPTKPLPTSSPSNAAPKSTTLKQATTPHPINNVQTNRPASPLPSSSPSAVSSAASSPSSSQHLDKNKPSASSKKKKKGGLAQLLASQKPKDSSSDPSGGAAGSGDSVLANFLMGL